MPERNSKQKHVKQSESHITSKHPATRTNLDQTSNKKGTYTIVIYLALRFTGSGKRKQPLHL